MFLDSSTLNLNYWSKQIIAREVDLEHMKRSRPKSDAESHRSNSQSSISKEKPAALTGPTPTSEFMKQRIRPLQEKQVSKRALDEKSENVNHLLKSFICKFI